MTRTSARAGTVMPALVVDRPGEASVQRVSRPQCGPSDVLVRLAAAGICGSDLELLDGLRPAGFVRYPIVPGHEWAGIVEEVGSEVRSVAPGDRVVAEGIRWCGGCARCREGRTNLCQAEYAETGFTHAGAFASYICIPAHLIHRLPVDADLSAAALLEPAACVATGLAEVDLQSGLSIAVVGGGTLGLLAISLFAGLPPARLVLIDVRPDRLALGSRLGAGETWNARDGDPAEHFGDSFDLVFEAAGRPGSAETAFRLARRGGTVLIEGIAGGSGSPLDADLIPLKHLRVQGVFGGSRAGWDAAVDLFARGRLDTRPLISHQFALDDFAAAVRTLRDPSAGAVKVQIVPPDADGGS